MENIITTRSELQKRFKKKIQRLQYVPYSEKITKWSWYGIALDLIPSLIISPNLSKVWNSLIKYSHGENEPLNCEKGILLCGNTGSTKTKTMEILNEYLEIDNVSYLKDGVDLKKMKFNIVSSLEIVSAYQKNGIEGLEKYLNYSNLCIDDLGSEQQEANYFGSKLNVLQHIIEERYNKSGFTHLTTNLKISQIEEQYGERVYSRIHEMCNIVELTGIDNRIK